MEKGGQSSGVLYLWLYGLNPWKLGKTPPGNSIFLPLEMDFHTPWSNNQIMESPINRIGRNRTLIGNRTNPELKGNRLSNGFRLPLKRERERINLE